MVFSKNVRIAAFVCLLAFETTTAHTQGNQHRSLMMPMHPGGVHPPVERPVAPVEHEAGVGTVGAGASGAVAGHAATAETNVASHGTSQHDACNPTQRVVNGKTVQSVSCNSMIFTQRWMPTLKYTAPKSSCVECIPGGEAKDWEGHVMIDSLEVTHPSKTTQGTKKLSEAAQNAIFKFNQQWHTFGIGKDQDKDLHEEEWKKHGRKTGLTDVQYVQELIRLQKEHHTPVALHTKQNKGVDTVMPLSELKQIFPKSCVVCVAKNGNQYFDRVKHCHIVNSKTKHAGGQVPFDGKHCKPCVETCSLPNIHIPHIVVA